MLEKAAEIVAFQRYKQQELIDEAAKRLHDAIEHSELARAAAKEAHDVAVVAELEASFLETNAGSYEEEERHRELAVAHTAHDLEGDELVVLEAALRREAQARLALNEAKEALEQLKQNAKDIKHSMHDLKEIQCDRKMNMWSKERGLHLLSFMDKAKAFLMEDTVHDLMENIEDEETKEALQKMDIRALSLELALNELKTEARLNNWRPEDKERILKYMAKTEEFLKDEKLQVDELAKHTHEQSQKVLADLEEHAKDLESILDELKSDSQVKKWTVQEKGPIWDYLHKASDYVKSRRDKMLHRIKH